MGENHLLLFTELRLRLTAFKLLQATQLLWNFKGVMTWEIKCALIFWHARGLCTIKKSCKSHSLRQRYFSYKNTSIHYRRPLFTPRSRVRHVLLWMCMLYLTTFGLLKKKHPPTPFLTLGRASKFFNITLIWFVWKKKVIYN